jgi:drug/metabolite transporter (DMT)-like permease
LLCEAAFTLLAVPLLQTVGPIGVSLHSTWIAAVMFGVMSVGTESVTAVTQLTSSHLLAAGYLAAVVTALAFVLWYSAVDRLGADQAGLFTGVTPVAAAVSGMTLGAAAPATGAWAGIALVATGLTLGLKAPPLVVVE